MWFGATNVTAGLTRGAKYSHRESHTDVQYNYVIYTASFPQRCQASPQLSLFSDLPTPSTMKPREYCCCAIPLVNAGIYLTLVEQFVLGIVVGTLSIGTPSSE